MWPPTWQKNKIRHCSLSFIYFTLIWITAFSTTQYGRYAVFHLEQKNSFLIVPGNYFHAGDGAPVLGYRLNALFYLSVTLPDPSCFNGSGASVFRNNWTQSAFFTAATKANSLGLKEGRAGLTGLAMPGNCPRVLKQNVDNELCWWTGGSLSPLTLKKVLRQTCSMRRCFRNVEWQAAECWESSTV